jgi:hypothetical protein
MLLICLIVAPRTDLDKRNDQRRNRGPRDHLSDYSRLIVSQFRFTAMFGEKIRDMTVFEIILKPFHHIDPIGYQKREPVHPGGFTEVWF